MQGMLGYARLYKNGLDTKTIESSWALPRSMLLWYGTSSLPEEEDWDAERGRGLVTAGIYTQTRSSRCLQKMYGMAVVGVVVRGMGSRGIAICLTSTFLKNPDVYFQTWYHPSTGLHIVNSSPGTVHLIWKRLAVTQSNVRFIQLSRHIRQPRRRSVQSQI